MADSHMKALEHNTNVIGFSKCKLVIALLVVHSHIKLSKLMINFLITETENKIIVNIAGIRIREDVLVLLVFSKMKCIKK